jgi:hypothetical protein
MEGVVLSTKVDSGSRVDVCLPAGPKSLKRKTPPVGGVFAVPKRLGCRGYQVQLVRMEGHFTGAFAIRKIGEYDTITHARDRHRTVGGHSPPTKGRAFTKRCGYGWSEGGRARNVAAAGWGESKLPGPVGEHDEAW